MFRSVGGGLAAPVGRVSLELAAQRSGSGSTMLSVCALKILLHVVKVWFRMIMVIHFLSNPGSCLLGCILCQMISFAGFQNARTPEGGSGAEIPMAFRRTSLPNSVAGACGAWRLVVKWEENV